MWVSDFEANLVSIASFRTARGIQRNSDSKKSFHRSEATARECGSLMAQVLLYIRSKKEV